MGRGRQPLIAIAVAAALVGCGDSGDGTAATSSTATTGSAPAAEEVVATIAGVEDGEVTGAELEAEVLASAEAERREPPAAGSPEFDLLAGEALDHLLVQRWIAAEAAEQGGEVGPEDAAALAREISGAGIEELRATWGPRTECDTAVVSRLCGGGGGTGGTEPPPDIPPASGLEEPPG